MKKFILFCLLSVASFGAQSCYDITKIDKPEDAAKNRALFVLIDETTPFNEALKEQVINNALKFVEHSNHIFVAKFSAFLQDHYNEVLFEFSLDAPLSDTQRYKINKANIAKFDKCLKDQLGYVRKNVKENIENAFLKEGQSVAKSDILYALNDFGTNAISINDYDDKVIIMASDMLENSAITSFYAKGQARKIEADKELAKVEKEGLFGDFGEAKVYAIGAGLTEGKKSYTTPQILNSINAFWKEYFNRSNATLVEMGTPALKREIK